MERGPVGHQGRSDEVFEEATGEDLVSEGRSPGACGAF